MLRNKSKDIIRKFIDQKEKGIPIIGGGAGNGLIAKCEESAGIDFIMVFNSGKFRLAGNGSLSGIMPYGNANDIVKNLALEIIPIVKKTPVIAGVCCTDPFIIPDKYIGQLFDLGFCGINNFPSVGIIDGMIRKNLEETGIGFEREVEFISIANKLGMLTVPYVFNEDEGELMCKAGANIIIAHMGCTVGGSIGAKSYNSLDHCAQKIQLIIDKIKSLNSKCIVLCQGGPISNSDEALYLLNNIDKLDGFCGASSFERLPTEISIKKTVEEFKYLRRN